MKITQKDFDQLLQQFDAIHESAEVNGVPVATANDYPPYLNNETLEIINRAQGQLECFRAFYAELARTFLKDKTTYLENECKFANEAHQVIAGKEITLFDGTKLAAPKLEDQSQEDFAQALLLSSKRFYNIYSDITLLKYANTMDANLRNILSAMPNNAYNCYITSNPNFQLLEKFCSEPKQVLSNRFLIAKLGTGRTDIERLELTKEHDDYKKAARKLEKLFGLEKGSCDISYGTLGLTISFTPTPSLENIEKYTKILTSANLNVSVFNYPYKGWQRGIECHCSIQDVVKALDEINHKARQLFVNTIKNSGSPLHQRNDTYSSSSNNISAEDRPALSK